MERSMIEMKGLLLKLALILLIASPCHAFDNWNTEEKIAQGVAIGLTIIDWGQTLYISDHSEYYEKWNFLLSEHPSRSSVNLYFGLSIIGKTALVHILPRDYNLFGFNIKPRRIVQSTYIVISGYNTFNNTRIGIKISF